MTPYILGGFDLQETSEEMVERILKMLEQFLISNQTLKLDETFKVYVKVYSIDHMNFKKTLPKRIQPKRTKAFYRQIHVRARRLIGSLWARSKVITLTDGLF